VKDYFDVLGEEMNDNSIAKGFWGEPEMMDKYVAKLGLIHSEVTEVLEALRKDKGPTEVTEEFADIIIRTLDLHRVLVTAGLADPQLERVVIEKMKKNAARPAKHGHSWG
jgi:NTP pyrophosphatase (non-canonical NTP hydrolase)